MIKVADFGLSEDIYSRNYFRQGKKKDESGLDVKLPIKWMAIESMIDGIFNEKTDVVSEFWSIIYISYYDTIRTMLKLLYSSFNVCMLYLQSISVVVWSDMLGGVQSWSYSVPCCGPFHFDQTP